MRTIFETTHHVGTTAERQMRRRMSHIDIWMKNPTRTQNSKIHGHGGRAALVSVRSREEPLWLAHRGKNGRKTKLRQRQGPGHNQPWGLFQE